MISKYDFIIPPIETVTVSICFMCIYHQNDRIIVSALAHLHRSVSINRQVNILSAHRLQSGT